MTDVLNIVTYNIHKGFSFFKRRMVIHDLRDHLRGLNADLVFLQEVLGHHRRHARRYHDWPHQPQFEFLADSVWSDYAYGKNAVYESGHHGNAVLSRFPIVRWGNKDISQHRFESRGLLHCEIAVPGWRQALHCVCVHLGLAASHRSVQMKTLQHHIERVVPADAPLVVAGDFNDWTLHAKHGLARALGLSEVFENFSGRPARSFPAALPLLRLDRIYVRGFGIQHAQVHHGNTWARISDHAALSTTIIRKR